jgi:hypothetical protein
MVFNTTFNNSSVTQMYIFAVSFIGGENHRPVTSHWQTWSHTAVLSRLTINRIRTRNVISDTHWLHRYIFFRWIQVMYFFPKYEIRNEILLETSWMWLIFIFVLVLRLFFITEYTDKKKFLSHIWYKCYFLKNFEVLFFPHQNGPI